MGCILGDKETLVKSGVGVFRTDGGVELLGYHTLPHAELVMSNEILV